MRSCSICIKLVDCVKIFTLAKSCEKFTEHKLELDKETESKEKIMNEQTKIATLSGLIEGSELSVKNIFICCSMIAVFMVIFCFLF